MENYKKIDIGIVVLWSIIIVLALIWMYNGINVLYENQKALLQQQQEIQYQLDHLK